MNNQTTKIILKSNKIKSLINSNKRNQKTNKVWVFQFIFSNKFEMIALIIKDLKMMVAIITDDDLFFRIKSNPIKGNSFHLYHSLSFQTYEESCHFYQRFEYDDPLNQQ